MGVFWSRLLAHALQCPFGERKNYTTMKTVHFSKVHYIFSAVVVLVVMANAVAPYVGLKWEYSLTMFSSMKTDCSNHLVFPSENVFGNYEYYFVEKMELENGAKPVHAELLLDLLETVGHPVATEVVWDPSDESRPVHGDMIRYHLFLFRNEGVSASFTVVDAHSGATSVMSTNDAPSPSDYSLWSAYPMVLHNYTEIHDVVRQYNSREKQSG